ncbi:MAG: TetR/AcrR family transcriptional regulator [Actinobacteria bacterium]|nr:MAG: TetR/AcrR family transcriptional regulator [Actinomycetota bacterium]
MRQETTSPHRAAYMQAMVDLAFERDYEEVTIEEIAARAGGTVEDFEAAFGSKEDCALTLVEEGWVENMRLVRGAFDAEERWPDSLRAAAYAHARWLVENPRLAHFGINELLRAGEKANVLREQIINSYLEMVEAGREFAEAPDSVPASTAESVVGAIAGLMARNSERSEPRDPVAAVPEMMYLAVRPYLGEEAARRELTIPPPND